MRYVATTNRAADLGGQRRPPQPADADADADDGRRVEPERGGAEHRRRRRSTPPEPAPSPIPAAKSTVMTTTASSRDAAGDHPAARVSGVARTFSRRPPVSSEAHLDTNVAAGEARRDVEELDVQLQEAARRPRSKLGRWRWIFSEFGSLAICADIGPTSEASTAPKRPSPMPHASARGSCSPKARLIGPRTPRTRPAGVGRPSPAVTPRSRRANSSTPMARKHHADDPHERQAGPVVQADERDVVAVQRNGLRAASGSERVEAVHDPQDDHHDAGHAGRPGTPEDRRQGERQATEEQGDEADPEDEADRRQRRDLVAQARIAERRWS